VTSFVDIKFGDVVIKFVPYEKHAITRFCGQKYLMQIGFTLVYGEKCFRKPVSYTFSVRKC